MQERNVLQEVFTATLTLFTDLLEPVKWFILAAVCLIVADLKFGIEAARKRGHSHLALQEKHPLYLENGKVKSGYLSLTPVENNTSYQAYILI